MSNASLPPASDGFVPSEADIQAVLDWFAEYDGHVAKQNIEAMADMALFPINEVTDGVARSTSRAEFVESMRQLLANGDDYTMESIRSPHFINENLVFVVTDATVTMGTRTYPMRYGDLLVKVGDTWKFQTMVQGGWGAA